MGQIKSYFKGFEGLRALAAIFVVISHGLQFILLRKIDDSFFNFTVWFPSGHSSVIFFFVLSGFLITYLLEKEFFLTGSFSIKNFLLRRFLRISPLYYSIFIVGVLLICKDLISVIFAFFMLPNVGQATMHHFVGSPQIWSIGVEQQFYLGLPLIYILFRKKGVFVPLVLFTIGYTILPHLVGFANERFFHTDQAMTFVNRFFFGSKFNCMALGAIGGYSLFNYPKVVNFFFQSRPIFMASVIALIALKTSWIKVNYFEDELISVFCLLILFSVQSERISLWVLESSLLKFVGKISYGIYMWHWVVYTLLIRYIFDSELYVNILIPTALIITVVVSWLSYKYLELPFLKMKKKYS